MEVLCAYVLKGDPKRANKQDSILNLNKTTLVLVELVPFVPFLQPSPLLYSQFSTTGSE